MTTALAWIGGIVVLIIAYKFILSPLVALVFPAFTGRAFFKDQLRRHGVPPETLPPVFIRNMADTARMMARHPQRAGFWEAYAQTLVDIADGTATVLRGDPNQFALDWIIEALRDAGVAIPPKRQLG